MDNHLHATTSPSGAGSEKYAGYPPDALGFMARSISDVTSSPSHTPKIRSPRDNNAFRGVTSNLTSLQYSDPRLQAAAEGDNATEARIQTAGDASQPRENGFCGIWQSEYNRAMQRATEQTIRKMSQSPAQQTEHGLSQSPPPLTTVMASQEGGSRPSNMQSEMRHDNALTGLQYEDNQRQQHQQLPPELLNSPNSAYFIFDNAGQFPDGYIPPPGIDFVTEQYNLFNCLYTKYGTQFSAQELRHDFQLLWWYRWDHPRYIPYTHAQTPGHTWEARHVIPFHFPAAASPAAASSDGRDPDPIMPTWLSVNWQKQIEERQRAQQSQLESARKRAAGEEETERTAGAVALLRMEQEGLQQQRLGKGQGQGQESREGHTEEVDGDDSDDELFLRERLSELLDGGHGGGFVDMEDAKREETVRAVARPTTLSLPFSGATISITTAVEDHRQSTSRRF